jgi:enamine deaminase RidA (YjgF/YER057c/UK114 family)
MKIKRLILISTLLFIQNNLASNTMIEHFSTEQTVEQNFPFSDAVRVGDTLYLSGMIGEDDNGNLVKGGIVPEAHNVMNKMDKILNHFDLTFDDVFKCLVMIDDINEWSLFNSVYIQYFKKTLSCKKCIWCRWSCWRCIF